MPDTHLNNPITGNPASPLQNLCNKTWIYSGCHHVLQGSTCKIIPSQFA